MKIREPNCIVCPRGCHLSAELDVTMVSCKTESPVPKGKVFEVVREINSVRAEGGVSIGGVLIENVAGTGGSVIATSNMVAD